MHVQVLKQALPLSVQPYLIRQASANGTHLLATNRTLFDDPAALLELFGAKIVNKDHDGSGFYLRPDNKTIFKRLQRQQMVFWKFNLGRYDLKAADSVYLPILTKGRPGPPEIIGGHEPTGFYAMGLKKHPRSKGVILPVNLGKLYYLHGYEQHKNILLDAIDHVFPGAGDLVQTNAPARVEVILQRYTRNMPQNLTQKTSDGLIVHLVNLTGFSGNTYFAPLPVRDLFFRVKCDFKPSRAFSMVGEKSVPFTWKAGFLEFTLPILHDFDGIVIDR